jgi:protocatechuate 3,4-dioxygenase beta subunit
MNYEKNSHDKTSTGLKYNNATAHAVMFGTNVSCTLTPDNANGPYYVLGEQIRRDVREGQPGVPMDLELQFVDVTTCKSLQPLVVDIWSCNATGVYSGVSAAGEGGWLLPSSVVFSKLTRIVSSTLIPFSLVIIQDVQPTNMFLPTPAPQSTRTVH